MAAHYTPYSIFIILYPLNFLVTAREYTYVKSITVKDVASRTAM